MRTLLFALALVGGPGPLSAEVPPVPPDPDPPALQGADLDLLKETQRIASRVEAIRGLRFPSPPVAVRAPADVQRLLAAERTGRALDAKRLAARARSWADLGLGSPERVLRSLATDLGDMGWDGEGRRLLVVPERLSGSDFVAVEAADPNAAVFMANGVRPDEPMVAHVLSHGLQSVRNGGESSWPDTTDGLLAERGWLEGEANLVAVRYLFQAMGLGDGVLEHDIDLSQLMGGILLPPWRDRLPAAERAMLEFVYEEGFAQAVKRYRSGGFRSLDEAAASRKTTRDVLHSDRPALGSGAPPPVPAQHLPDPFLALVDRDVLGEQGVIVLVSTLTGKDDLALVAGDGWSEDHLLRFEPREGEGPGVTIWETRWSSPGDAAEFDYAFGRSLEDGFSGAKLTEASPGRRSAVASDRVYRIDRKQAQVSVRIAPLDIDRRLEGTAGGGPPQKAIRKSKK